MRGTITPSRNGVLPYGTGCSNVIVHTTVARHHGIRVKVGNQRATGALQERTRTYPLGTGAAAKVHPTRLAVLGGLYTGDHRPWRVGSLRRAYVGSSSACQHDSSRLVSIWRFSIHSWPPQERAAHTDCAVAMHNCAGTTKIHTERLRTAAGLLCLPYHARMTLVRCDKGQLRPSRYLQGLHAEVFCVVKEPFSGEMRGNFRKEVELRVLRELHGLLPCRLTQWLGRH